jgi:hypothetical protein
MSNFYHVHDRAFAQMMARAEKDRCHTARQQWGLGSPKCATPSKLAGVFPEAVPLCRQPAMAGRSGPMPGDCSHHD